MLKIPAVHELKRTLAETADIVDHPDHPLVIRGPEIIARDDHGLSAYFVAVDGSPMPDTSREMARVLLSRLALPTATSFVLFWARSEAFLPGFAGLFDRVLIREQRGRLSEDSWESPRKYVEMCRAAHFHRFGEIQRDIAAHGLARFADRDEHVRTTFEQFRDALPPMPRWIDVSPEGLVATFSDSYSRHQVMERARSIAEFAALGDYGLMYGLAGLRDVAPVLEAEVGLATHIVYASDNVRAARRSADPLKAIRAAAFAGTKMTGTTS